MRQTVSAPDESFALSGSATLADEEKFESWEVWEFEGWEVWKFVACVTP